jgi:hypothetical protein
MKKIALISCVKTKRKTSIPIDAGLLYISDLFKKSLDYCKLNYDVTYIVFRPNRINVTQDLRYAATDAGKIRIVEKTIIPDDIDDIEESIEEQY